MSNLISTDVKEEMGDIKSMGCEEDLLNSVTCLESGEYVIQAYGGDCKESKSILCVEDCTSDIAIVISSDILALMMKVGKVSMN